MGIEGMGKGLIGRIVRAGAMVGVLGGPAAGLSGCPDCSTPDFGLSPLEQAICHADDSHSDPVPPEAYQYVVPQPTSVHVPYDIASACERKYPQPDDVEVATGEFGQCIRERLQIRATGGVGIGEYPCAEIRHEYGGWRCDLD